MRAVPDALRLARREIVHPGQGVALAEARRQNPAERDLAGWCLLSVRTWLGIPSRHRSAIAAWNATPPDQRHTRGVPPAGAPVFWAIGKFGHVALSAGSGRVISTDIKRGGKADLVDLDLIAARWGARYLGWTESLNGHRVPLARPAATASAGRVVEVRRGDTLAALAGPTWRDVWRHERNAALRDLRGRPEAIRPGDRLWLP